MQLPFLSKTKSNGEVYCGILLKEAHGTCFLYQQNADTLSLLKQKQFQYSDGWEHIVDDIDEALSLLEQEIGQGTTKKCIYFIFSHLIDQQTKEIIKPYITKMKEIAVSLEMKPVGYLEVIDAVHEYIEKQKQIRLSSLAIEIDDTKLTVFVFIGGHKVEVHSVSRTDVFCDDVEEALSKVELHVLPTHIYMYNSTDLAEESSDLLMHGWKKELFAQQPRIDILSKSMVDTALHQLLQKQLCGQVVSATIEDVPQKKDVLGFVIGKDVSEQQPSKEATPSVLPKQTEKKPIFSLPHVPSFRFPYIKVGIGILIIALLVTGFLYFFHSAAITLYAPKVSKHTSTSVIASENVVDTSIAKLDSTLKTFTYKEKKDTTGKRDIGEKASGEVNIYSYDDKERQLPKGTKLQTGSLIFETSDQIQVPASQFASDGITKNPGKAKIGVQAVAIGTESNVAKNSRFSVGDNASSVLFGLNESALSGGTKKTIRTVAAADREALRALLIEKAKKDGLGEKSNKSRLVVSELSKVVLSKEEFSAEVGEETNTLTLSATAEATTYSISTISIEALIKQDLEKEKPSGYQTENVTFTVKSQKKSGKNNIELSVEGKADFVKIIDQKKVAKQITGISVDEAKVQIKQDFSIEQMSIKISPNIPIIESRMPLWTEHVYIQIKK